MRRSTKWGAGAAVLAAGAVLLRPGTHAHRVARQQLHLAGRKARYAGGKLQGEVYRARGRQPDPNVADDVLADRVRSSLGGLEKRLDLPRVHVMVQEHVVSLHGSVGTRDDADAIVRTVASVSGVGGVDSHLHVGLSSGDCRPSEGRGRTASTEDTGDTSSPGGANR